MPLPDVADTFRITVHQTNQGEELLNVFHYRDTAVAGPSAMSVAQGFWDKVKVAWRAIPTTTTAYTFDWVMAEALYPPYLFATLFIPSAEQAPTRVQAGDPQPTYVAALLRLTVGNRSTRPGGKRISGLIEIDTVGNNVVSTFVTLVSTLGALLDEPFTTVPGVVSMAPVIVGYPTPAPSSKPLRVQDVIGYSVDNRVSHQVSRDPRRR